jgi:trans-aconitate methyltransferase
MSASPSSPAFFEAKYQQQPDFWGFASKPEELFRYGRIIAAVEDRRYRQGFEPGCSVGVLTERLSALCDHVEAFDFSSTASAQARERCAPLHNVEIHCAALPDRMPGPQTDLLVLSEIGYYWTETEWRKLAGLLVDSLQPGATVLAAHWLGHSPDHRLSGDRVHEILLESPQLLLSHSERHPAFRLDRLVRR